MPRPTYYQLLQERRLELGISLNTASRNLGIDETMLDALESGNPEDLPDRQTTRDILFAYAMYLGLSPSAMVETYEQDMRERRERKGALPPQPSTPSRTSSQDREARQRGRPQRHRRPHDKRRPHRRRSLLPIAALFCAVIGVVIVLIVVFAPRQEGITAVDDANAPDMTSHDVSASTLPNSPGETTTTSTSDIPEIDEEAVAQEMDSRAKDQTSETEWLIMVDCTANRTGVYKGKKGDWQRKGFVVVSCGDMDDSPTILGTFKLEDRDYSFNGFDHTFRAYYTCYYWTRFDGPYMFHSQPYHLESFDILDDRLGQNVSQGCVRMRIEDAKWIHDNMPIGTTVITYTT